MKHYVLSGMLVFASISQAATFKELYNQRKAYLQDFYQDIHQNPELSGQEKRTAQKLADEFKSLGFEVEMIGGGVVGVLRNGKGPVTLVRTELDALPVTEKTSLSFKSKNEGVMHACGHDMHMTAIAGTAFVMANTKEQWQGTLVFIGQPAEELGQGAENMIKAGLFKKIPKPDQTIAMHVTGIYKNGQLVISPGHSMANVDSVEVVFKGKGTHGSAPENGIDPFIMAADYVLRMQALVGREKKATQPAVISVGAIHGGTKSNIIPDDVTLKLTVRTYDAELRKKLLTRMSEIAKYIAKSSNAPEPTFNIPEQTDALFNDIALAERTMKVFTTKFGKDVAIKGEPMMGAEDFGYFGVAAKAPTLMYWIGTASSKDSPVNHSSLFAPEYKTIAPIAVESMTTALMDFHKKPSGLNSVSQNEN